MKPQYELGEIWELIKMLVMRVRKYFMESARVRVLAGVLLALLIIIVLLVSGGDLPFSAIAHARNL